MHCLLMNIKMLFFSTSTAELYYISKNLLQKDASAFNDTIIMAFLIKCPLTELLQYTV